MISPESFVLFLLGWMTFDAVVMIIMGAFQISRTYDLKPNHDGADVIKGLIYLGIVAVLAVI